MTNPMLADLDEVVRLKGYIKQSREHFDHAKSAALQFLINHHSTLADMAKRLEAVERDAARYAFLRDKQATIIYKRKGHGVWEPLIDTRETSTRCASLDEAVDAAIDATQEDEG